MHSLLQKLEEDLTQLVVHHTKIKEENHSLREELSEMKENLKTEQKQTQELKNKIQQLQVANGLLGNQDHRKLMKLKLNLLIREVDHCIAQIQNKRY